MKAKTKLLASLLFALALVGPAHAGLARGEAPPDLLGKDQNGEEVRISA